MNRQVWISDEAYEYARKVAFEQKKYIGQVVSEALLKKMPYSEALLKKMP